MAARVDHVARRASKLQSSSQQSSSFNDSHKPAGFAVVTLSDVTLCCFSIVKHGAGPMCGRSGGAAASWIEDTEVCCTSVLCSGLRP